MRFSETVCYVVSLNRTVIPVSDASFEISSNGTCRDLPKTSIRGKLSILTSLRNSWPILLPISCKKFIIII